MHLLNNSHTQTNSIPTANLTAVITIRILLLFLCNYFSRFGYTAFHKLKMRYFVIFSYLLIGLSIFSSTDAKGCKDYLNELGDKQRLFIQCVTNNAAPIKMCIDCEPQFTDMVVQYNQLRDTCADIYFDKDRVNIVSSTQMALTKLWNKAFCDDCFNNDHWHVFDQRHGLFSNCINNTINKNYECMRCAAKYLSLNDYYNNLEVHSKGKVCYDLQDTMNRTRELWSKKLNCGKSVHNFSLFFIATSIVGVLPIIFYGGICALHARRQAQNVNSSEAPQIEITLPANANPNAVETAVQTAVQTTAVAESPNTSNHQFTEYQSILKLNKEDSDDSDGSRSVDA